MILTVHVKPSAKQNAILEKIDGDTIKVSVTAPPEKGRANAATIALLSKTLKISKSEIDLVRGHTTRMKQFKIPIAAMEHLKNMNL